MKSERMCADAETIIQC